MGDSLQWSLFQVVRLFVCADNMAEDGVDDGSPALTAATDH